MLKSITEETVEKVDVPIFFFSFSLSIYYSYRDLKLFNQSHGRWLILKFSV